MSQRTILTEKVEIPREDDMLAASSTFCQRVNQGCIDRLTNEINEFLH